jgi:hypothetical protein
MHPSGPGEEGKPSHCPSSRIGPEACMEMVTKQNSIFRRDVTGNHRWGSFGQKNPSGPRKGKLSFWWNTIDRINEIPVDSPYRLSALDTILLSDWPTPMKYDRVILFSLRCRWRMGIPGNDSDNGLINPFIHPTGINFLQWLDNENRAKPDFWVIN